MLPSTAFIPSSVILNNNNHHLQHAFLATTFRSVTSFPRGAPLHLKEDNESHNNQHITQDGDELLLPTTAFLLASAFSSICTIWSEYAVLTTGCGPRLLSDALERGSYLGVLVVAGLSVFVRIVSGGQSLSDVYNNSMSKSSGMNNNYKLYVNLVENLSLFAVVGAFVALGMQSIKGTQMDGLSGINVDMCRAIQQSIE